MSKNIQMVKAREEKQTQISAIGLGYLNKFQQFFLIFSTIRSPQSYKQTVHLNLK